MSEFVFRLTFAIFGAYIGRKRGGYLTMFICAFIGCIVGDLMFSMM